MTVLVGDAAAGTSAWITLALVLGLVALRLVAVLAVSTDPGAPAAGSTLGD